MRKTLSVLFAIVVIYSSCTKDHAVTPAKTNSFKVSFKPSVEDVVNSSWQQVLGGEAYVGFTFQGADTLNASVVSDSLNLKNIATYSRLLLAGTYNITLATKSTAVADTFIRFNAQVNNFLINQNQAISLTATTNDGVITISKSMIAAGTVPTFTPAGTSTALNFGFANGYYFIYVTGNTTGRIAFTEATTGNQYLQDITVSSLNQYDLSPILNTSGVAMQLHHFNLKADLKKTNL